MKRDLGALAGQLFDLIVIGGGIQGAATARDAALGGLKVALVEAGDFASGTSSRSTKLIHGGLRYLEHYEFKLVREARQERRLLTALAPHLARPVQFLVPIYRGDSFSPLKIRLGLTLYDALGNLGPADRHRMLSARQALALMPALRPEGLRAAAIYHDSGTDDARLTIENVIDAADHGAVVANYASVCALAMSNGQVIAAEVEDAITGRRLEITGKFFLNATGPWVDRVRALTPGYDGSRTVRLTKGVHFVVPPVTGDLALLAAIPGENRVMLMWPWHQGAMLGTTDTDFEGDPATVKPDEADVRYLLQAANRIFTRPLTKADVSSPWAGLRALVLESGSGPRNPSAVTREYRFHEDPWARNFVSVCGGKLTTARALGEKLARLVAARLGRTLNGASSRTTPLPGGRTGEFESFLRSAIETGEREFHLPQTTVDRIARTYGSRWRSVLEPVRLQPELAQPLLARTDAGPELIAAEARFAIDEEMAMSSEDFLLRRSGLSWTGSLLAGAAPVIDQLLADSSLHGVAASR
jgi:glycerol-3-phosphate dehydrogenase